MLGKMIIVAKNPPSGQEVGGSKGERAQQQQEHVQSLHTQILGKHHAIPR
jgi:hypothetical protein